MKNVLFCGSTSILANELVRRISKAGFKLTSADTVVAVSHAFTPDSSSFHHVIVEEIPGRLSWEACWQFCRSRCEKFWVVGWEDDGTLWVKATEDGVLGQRFVLSGESFLTVLANE